MPADVAEFFSRRGLLDDATRQAMEGLQRKIEAGIRDAFGRGMDFVHEPADLTSPDYLELFDITRPVMHTVEVRGGPVAPGLDWPRDFTVYRVASVSEDERRRLAAGRHDWRSDEWQDHCGDADCTECDGEMPLP